VLRISAAADYQTPAPREGSYYHNARGWSLFIERSDGSSSTDSQATGQVQGMQGMACIEDVTDGEKQVDKK